MEMGKYSYCSESNLRLFWPNKDAKLKIGKFCSIASNVDFYMGGNHRTDWITTYPFGHLHKDVFTTFNGEGCPKTNGDIIIGNDVWIGDNATIMSGITVGDGAVIACNSHVVKNVEPYSIVGGNPAKLIKYRFTPKQIKQLLKIKWWDWDDEKINKVVPLLCNSNIDLFLRLGNNVP